MSNPGSFRIEIDAAKSGIPSISFYIVIKK